MNLLYLFVEEIPHLFDIILVLCRDEDTLPVHMRHPRFLQIVKADVFGGRGTKIILVFFNVSEGIDFIENNIGRLIPRPYLQQGLVNDLYLLFKTGMLNINYMQEYI